ncbi:hypothetical protein [Oscillatoria sp. CS-180]|uniref:hypothetical protein n=1 Tax=Oscillatoria sp. CS-180 TaxID=3021720 RepID=UPI00232DB214|nr:hypothetical protein [Oscillatoria sp. CS-180]
MTIQDLESQLLQLDSATKLHLIQVLAQSMVPSTIANPIEKTQANQSESSLVDFFYNSPLREFADEIDLSRDPSSIPDRTSL